MKHRLQFAITDRTWNNNHLLVTLVQAARTIVFDCGPMAVPRSIAHQVTDICISHRHMDHLQGFAGLARALLASRRPIRVIGPRGIGRALSNLLRAFEWNYARELSLKLDVIEVEDAETVSTVRLDIKNSFAHKLGSQRQRQPVVFSDSALELRAFDVEHHISCLAYRLKLPDEWHVRREILDEMGVRTGPWLGQLLRRLPPNDPIADDEMVPADALRPDAKPVSLRRVVDEGIVHERGLMLGWVTDTADTPAVRGRLREHLTGADVLFCEAFYARAETDVAGKVGHLTSIQTGEIATELGVKQLIVTHISQRYPPARVLAEVRSVFPQTMPKTAFFLGATDADADDDTADPLDADGPTI